MNQHQDKVTVSTFFSGSKLKIFLSKDFCELNPNVFSDLEYDELRKGYILPAEDYDLYSYEISRTTLMMNELFKDGVDLDGSWDIAE